MFRWGIIGSGFAARKFVLGLRQSRLCSVTLVHSRTRAHAEAFARDLAIPHVAPTLDEAVQSDQVDAFYIASPPTLHREQALACFKAGKPVLIEKPFAASLADAEAIVEAAREARLFCMEGLWTLHLPILAPLRQALASGAIGAPRSLSASFGASNIPDSSDNQFNAKLGGGALLHRAVYPLALALGLLGPARLAASAATLNADGVDEDCVTVLRHEEGALSTLRASLRAPLANDLSIEGTHGVLHVRAPIYRPYRFTVTRTQPSRRSGGGGKLAALRDSSLAQGLQQRLGPLTGALGFSKRQGEFLPYEGNGYHYQADEAARCVAAGLIESEIAPLSRSVLAAALLEQARRAWTPAGTGI